MFGGEHAQRKLINWFAGVLEKDNIANLLVPFFYAAPGSQISDLFHLEVQRERKQTVCGCVFVKETFRYALVDAVSHFWQIFTLVVTF